MAESISEGTLKSWSKKEGDTVQVDEEVATIETDKIDVQVNAPKSGTIVKLLANEEDTVTVGQDLFVIEEGEVSSEAPKEESKPAAETKDASEPKDQQVDKKLPQESAPAPSDKSKPPPRPTETRDEPKPKESKPASKESKAPAAPRPAAGARTETRVLKEHDVKLGFMSAFAKADYVDLSVAVATPKGLVTPVVRNAEGMNFIDIEKEIAGLGRSARVLALDLHLQANRTMFVGPSNGGVFGSLYGTPIINLPQAAIVIRPIMVVALTYDHRLLDGREAVTFLVRVKEYIEDPRKMLLA
ncbi:CoA-dependent acyltransferase [Coprinellus micaceus]|uniref:Dihydrolipoamide acetyltransferase component of pyruvate dehydrogenase complex n=1 Tax=Coprinellus micaceus TaxID=71717 RepID=A0A4Y7SD68_COPMI|nr:CoA-dependent acyltransferase [Coprinellus micaceus]